MRAAMPNLLALALLLSLGLSLSILPDLALLLLICGVCHFSLQRMAPAITRISGTWLLLLLLIVLADFCLQRFFGRTLDIKYDLFLLPALKDLTLTALGGWYAALAVLIVFAIGALCAGGLAYLLRRASSIKLIKAPLISLLALAYLVSWASLDGARDAPLTIRSAEIVAGVAGAIEIVDGDKAFDRRLAFAQSRDLLLPSGLRQTQDRDVIFVFVESYGRALWDSSELRAPFAKLQDEFQSQLAQAGYLSSSRFVRSSVVGGGSWLAHMTLMSGVPCNQQLCWEALLASQVRALPHFFANKGYEAVSVLPAMDIDAWPEGAWYGYTRDIWTRQLAYDGWKYGWSPMPDQYVWLRLDEILFSTSSKPIFAEIALTSSHHPFALLPPYHEGNWDHAALNETLQAAGRPIGDRTIWVNPQSDDYLRAIQYSLTSSWDFLIEHYERDGIFIIIGDHQPPLAVIDEDDLPSAHRADVPIHIVSKDPALHRHLASNGFKNGLFPDEQPASMPMKDIKAWLLTLLDTRWGASNDS